MTQQSSGLRIGLALGGGGARGLTHLHVLEAFDELGLKPAAVTGSSIGAIYGAAYAAGLPALDLRAHTVRMLRTRSEVVAKVLKARVGRMSDLFGSGSWNPVLVDAEQLLRQFLPEGLPETIEELSIPFAAIATDFFERTEIVLRSGPLVPAVAASAAIPGLFRPVIHGDRTLIDGAFVNPLPFDRFEPAVDVVVAVDVTGGPAIGGSGPPNAFAAMLGGVQIMQQTILAGKLAQRAPDVVIRPKVDAFNLFDFLKTSAVLRSTEATKDEAKRAIAALVERAR
jgi:NTE family protein